MKIPNQLTIFHWQRDWYNNFSIVIIFPSFCVGNISDGKMKRDLITLLDYSSAEILSLVDWADRLKKQKGKPRADLKGKSVALVFQKPSNRTRVSFEVGIYELGGHCLYLGPDEINLGKRESTHDVAKTLSRYVHCIVARVFNHKDIVELAQHADVPVINALCDYYHPCQALADIQTIREQLGGFKGLTLARARRLRPMLCRCCGG